MKKNLFPFAFILLAQCTVAPDMCMSQWQPDVRLTNNASPSYPSQSGAWCIAASGNTVHVVWYDGRDLNDEIYYKRSTDGGLTWGPDTRLTNNAGFSREVSVAVSGATVLVVWSDARDAQSEIYSKRSADGGLTWGADARLSTLDYKYSALPSAAISGSVAAVVWEDSRKGSAIFFKGSSDGGISWGAEKWLSDSTAPGSRGSVSVAISGSIVHVAWSDSRNDPNGEIYYKRSIDGGITWGADTRLTNDANYSFSPSIAAVGSAVHVAWTDTRGGSNQIYYKRSRDEGLTWGADTSLTQSSVMLHRANMAASGSNVHIVWRNVTTGTTELYYTHSADQGSHWDAELQLTQTMALSYAGLASVAASGSTVHAVWSDQRDGNPEVYYKRNPTGNAAGSSSVGTMTMNAKIPNDYSLDQNYPNPFNPSTRISFSLPSRSFVSLKVFDALGRQTATLASEELSAGSHTRQWNAEGAPSGMYFSVLRAGAFAAVRSLMLVK